MTFGHMTSAQAESQHWSFQPLNPGQPPSLKESTWGSNPIDGYILAKLKESDLSPQPEANRHSLIRRLTAGLTGLPPSPEEIENFVSDTSPEAYSKLVDRLLDSKHYGERWARHWLDVARFGESDGILTVNEDKVRANAWRYRDSVIRAFNADLPFDQFVRYQVSSPLDTPEEYKELKQFVNLGTRLQQNADPNDRMFHRLDDVVSTTGSAFLGLTFGCARCHDHPVDPMSTEEYYELAAIFFDQFKENPIAKKRTIPIKITEPRVLKKGSWRSPGDAVSPGFFKELMKQPASYWIHDGQERNTGLADWLTDTENGAGHQLARVIVNRLWHHHFGQGLVNTPNDFGLLGDTPSHPKLLDWLAMTLIENGWKLKPIHRLIVTSATYRQTVASDPAPLKQDVTNRLLWHRPVRRLEAEMIRDRLLAVAGELKTDLYGPSISIGGYKKTVEDTPKSWRRSIYLQVHRTVRHPTLSLFDPPITETSVGARSTGTAPEGALFALNAPLVWTLADKLARRVTKEAGKDHSDQIKHLYLLTLTRPPTSEEMKIGLELLGKESPNSLVSYCHIILGLNEFIYVQ